MPKLYHSHSGPHFFTLSVTTFPQSLVMSQTFSRPPPAVPDAILSSPRPHVLLVTLNRPAQLNALPRRAHFALADLWAWYDAEPGLRCAVVTGRGRAFCAGADLKEWNDKHQGDDHGPAAEKWAGDGFGGLSNRRGKKPVIAAVNGLCLGGGFEMALNVDMVIAAETAKFGLPEVARGVVAIAGALPRITRTLGRQRASEMALLGRMYNAAQLETWGLVNKVVKPAGGGGAVASTQEDVNAAVVEEALNWAAEMAGNSPDAVIVSREGLLGGWDAEDPKESTGRLDRGLYRDIDGGENMREGVRSFVEKRRAVWRDSKL